MPQNPAGKVPTPFAGTSKVDHEPESEKEPVVSKRKTSPLAANVAWAHGA